MEHNSKNEYRTGGSMPPDRPGGLFAVAILILLSAAGIFLTAGFNMLRTGATSADKELAALYVPDATTYPANDLHMDGEVTDVDTVGIICQSISEFCEKYYELPAGIYILQVTADSPAARQGVLPGDVLTRVNGKALRLPGTLQNILESSPPNSLLPLEFSRKGKSYTIYVIAGK